MLTALYRWLDLNGPDGKPSHSKVLASVTQFVLLAGLIILALRITELTMAFVALAFVVGALPFGLDGLKTILKGRAALPAT